VALIRHILASIGIEQERLALEWASAAEAVRFVDLITAFTHTIKRLGPLQPDASLMVKMKAAKPALEDVPLRMALARRARAAKKEKDLHTPPSEQEIVEGMEHVIAKEMAAKELMLHLKERPLTLEQCAERLNRAEEDVKEIFSKLKKKGLVEPDRLIFADRAPE
jgi:F420-non-reducing hydrogenase iron-sulfur subunit